MPQTLYTNTPILVVEDQVTYGTGGRWGEWSSGGGSSLELIDPHSNHRLAANWADSDETQKSSWVDIENTGVLDNGANYDPSIDYAQIGLLDAGECLVDNIEVDYNGTNYVSNGTFESGTNGWSFQGCMTRSSLENTGYRQQPFPAHPLQRPDLDRGQFLPGGLEHQPDGIRPDSDAALQGALAARLAGSAAPLERQLARSHGGNAGSDQPRFAGDAQQPLRDQCGTGHLQRHPQSDGAGSQSGGGGDGQRERPGRGDKPDVVLPARSGDELHRRGHEGQWHGRRRGSGRWCFQRDHSGTGCKSNRRFLYFRHGQPRGGDALSGVASAGQ